MSRTVKRAFRYRFYPTDAQAAELARTFGCVRLVYNLALQARTEAWTLRQERVTYAAALARAQRNLARKEKGSANRAKARLKVARVHARITDRRRDHLHKLTTRLVHENQVIVIEDLTVRNMVTNHRLARAISDAGWRQFRTLLDYKADWHGRTLVVVDRWFPSSKLCSTCGALTERMPLTVRTWTCRCGQTHDRDVNAARTILAEGHSVIACGDGVRPQRADARTGRPSVKQEPPGVTQGIPVP